jgi:TonB-linked SusC/RagA family outer membrane protein
MNGPTFTNFKKWALINQTPGVYSGLNDPKFLTDGTFTPEEIQGINANRSTNWQKLIFHTGMMTDHQIGVSGGSETTQYSLSGGYYRETGVYEGQSFERYSFRAAVDQLLGKSVKIGISTQNSYSVTNGEIATDVSNPMGQAYRANPLVSPYDSTGKLVNAYLPGNANQVWNPLANFLPGATVETRKRFGTFTTAYLEASLAPGLKYRFNGGAELRSDVYGNFFARNTSYNQGAQSTGSNRNSFSANYTLENLLIYDKIFAQKHKINFTALYSLQESQTQTTRFDYNNVLADALQYFNPQYASNLASSKNSSPKWDIISYMGRLNYSFADKYLLTLTMRSDGSSRLAPGNKYHVFPSAAVAWNMIQEPFLAGVTGLTNLKLRASYGTVGNTAIDPYKTLGALSPATYNYGTVNTTGAYLTDVPNPNLTWEYTSTLNIGLDFGLLQNRISGSVELYQQKTHDLLLPQSLPPTSGIQNANVTNIGKTENKGIELHINTINIQSGKDNGFSWATDLNIFINRGKITQLANGVTQDINNNWFVGQPIGAIFDYKRVGVWQATPGDTSLAQSLGLTTTGSGSVIGQIRVADLNGSKTIDPGDRIILGNSQPKFEGGITNRFSYKGFDFTVVAFGRYGGTLVSKMHQSGSFINTYQSNYNNLNAHYWTPTNGENYYPKPNHAQTNPPNSSLLTYFDASYLKIRSLSLGYSLPQSLIKRAGIQRMRVYATAANPFILFSSYRNKYHGLDPEVSQQSGSGTGNQAALNVDTPPTWSMIFGLNVSF